VEITSTYLCIFNLVTYVVCTICKCNIESSISDIYPYWFMDVTFYFSLHKTTPFVMGLKLDSMHIHAVSDCVNIQSQLSSLRFEPFSCNQ